MTNTNTDTGGTATTMPRFSSADAAMTPVYRTAFQPAEDNLGMPPALRDL